MRNVCIFCEKFGSGGIESFLFNVLQHMDRRDLNIDIIIGKIESEFYSAQLKKLGIGIYELSGSTYRVVKNHLLFRQLLKGKTYDVLHLNIYNGVSLFYGHDGKMAGIPIRIAHSHNSALRRSRMWALKQIMHNFCKTFLVNQVTDLWACSLLAAKFMFPLKKTQNVKIIPNGIELERFLLNEKKRNQVRSELGLKNCFVIGHVGRLCYQKNQVFLLDVFSEILKQDKWVRLLLVGSGSDEKKLREKAEGMGITDQVIFYGESQEIEQLYWAMDIFVFPSIFEGLGIVVLEAQVSGLPVICSTAVPKEAIITNDVVQLELESGSKIWGESILQKKDFVRNSDIVKGKMCEYDIDKVSETIYKKYSDIV